MSTGHRLFPNVNRDGGGGSWWQEHSLSLFLAAVLVVQTGGWAVAKLAGPTWDEWAGEWLLSILADTYGALLLVLASKWFFERGSSESK